MDFSKEFWTALAGLAAMGTGYLAFLVAKLNRPPMRPLPLAPSPELQAVADKIGEDMETIRDAVGVLKGQLTFFHELPEDLSKVRERQAVTEHAVKRIESAVEDMRTETHKIKHSIGNLEARAQAAETLFLQAKRSSNGH